MISRKIVLLLLLLIGKSSFANNIQISNITLTGQNTTTDQTSVSFNLTWENSWRISTGPANWDAAWVFVKYRVAGGPWLHAFLNNTGHTAGTGTPILINPGMMNTANPFNATTNPAMGVFVYRSSNGSGTFSQTGLQLQWNYGANGIPDGAAVDVKVFAIEMVYVPQGVFKVGSGGTYAAQFGNGNSTTSPLSISSENALTLGGTVNGNLTNGNGSGMNVDGQDDFNNTTTKTLPATFPKGFNSFYCMKYEITQQQWIDFFNVLSTVQKANRDITGGTLNSTGKAADAIVNRNNVNWTSGDATLNGGTHGNVACNFISYMDGAAFADWASLRPMTELEFEKACRGTMTPVQDEYAWLTTSIIGATGISNSGANNEVASNVGANVNLSSTTGGPLRVGSFATASSSREQAGATFYGIMEMSGNLNERTVSVGNAVGRNFTAPIHGNGLLTSDGFCDISSWPGFVTDKVSGVTGAGLRGGNFDPGSATTPPYPSLGVSFRSNASTFVTNRDYRYGFRAVRSVP
jgi:formylglycine-generating enzyme required for sulfatase activity